MRKDGNQGLARPSRASAVGPNTRRYMQQVAVEGRTVKALDGKLADFTHHQLDCSDRHHFLLAGQNAVQW